MTHPLAAELQTIANTWQYFAPCLGANITLYDSRYGYWSGASGYRSIDPYEPLTPHELFYIYSITKTVTAVVVMRLVEAGSVALDAPIAQYLDDLKLPEGVTIQRLLNHTSGVPSYTNLPDYVDATRENPAVPWSFEYVIERTCKGALDFEPGEGWDYSNTGMHACCCC